MQESCSILNIKFRYISVGHSQANYVERRIQECNKVMARFCYKESREWMKYIYLAAKFLNDIPNKSLGLSPTEIMYAFKPVSIIDKLLAPAETADLKRQKKIIESKVHDVVVARMKKARENYKKYYDKHCCESEFQVGQLVALCDRPKPSLKHNVRFMQNYSAPWEIKEKLSPINYIIGWAGPTCTRAKQSKEFLIHISKLKKYHSHVIERLLSFLV
jgi:hypothetical protein